MNETITTIVGNVVDQPSRRTLDSGVSVTSFRVASTARRFDRVTNRWVDGESLYLKVTCWRSLAENTEACVVKGDPVVVTGRLYTRLYQVAESRRAAYELEATAIGFDLNRGRASFRRISSSRATTVDETGPDGLPTGSAVDAHLESGVSVETGASTGSGRSTGSGLPVETDEPLDDAPVDDAGSDDAGADDAGAGAPTDGPLPAFSDAERDGHPVEADPVDAAPSPRNDEAGDDAPATGRATVTATPRVPGRRRSTSHVPA